MQNVHRFSYLIGLLALSTALAPEAFPQEQRSSSDSSTFVTKVIRVGITHDTRTLFKAAQIARDGDIIEVDPGEYLGDTAVWTQNDLIIRGTGVRPRLVAENGRSAEGKGTFVIRGGNVTIENLAFFGARVADRNGAGIRLERGKLRVVNCAFEDNENGILTSNDASVELQVVDSTFLNNGAGNGMSHHLYAGTIAKLEVKGGYFGPARKGHLLKSRAKTTSVFYSRLTGETGSSSYEIDIPNGGEFKAIGNLVQQGNDTDNSALISFGAEGYRWPVNRAHIAFNTLVNDLSQGGVFITVRPGPAEAFVSNNLLVGRGHLDLKSPATVKGNVQARPADFVDAARFNYRLRAGSPLIGGAGPVAAFSAEDRPNAEYRHVAGSVDLAGFSSLTPLSPGAFQGVAR